MFKKTYVGNVLKNGVLFGTAAMEEWIWVSAYDAWETLSTHCIEKGLKLVDFRRVK